MRAATSAASSAAHKVATTAATAATTGAAALVAGLIVALVGVPLWSLGRIAAGAGLTGIWRVLSGPGGRVALVSNGRDQGRGSVLGDPGDLVTGRQVRQRRGPSRPGDRP